MRAICLYLHIHQPYRYRQYSIFSTGHDHNYWEDDFNSKQSNERIFLKVAEKSYHPTFDMLERNLQKYPGFKVSLSVTGTWLEQAEAWDPALIEQLRRLVATGRVEIVAETYYHSLAFFYDREEFEVQVRLHQERVRELLGAKTQVFRNTELSYNDEIGRWAEGFGFKAVLAEGWDKVLGWRSPNHVYAVAGGEGTGAFETSGGMGFDEPGIGINGMDADAGVAGGVEKSPRREKCKLLLKNYRLSDDIAFRFSNRGWKEWPLTVEKYQHWLNMDCLRGPLVNLFMDFETFGEHQWADTGIFKFMDHLIYSWLKEYDNHFVTVSEAAELEPAVDEISMPNTVTWADTERDLSAWMGNAMQHEALRLLYDLRPQVYEKGDQRLLEDFRKLTTSDHAYYMCTKYWNDGDVHAYFSAYDSPYDAFMFYMNVVRDLEYRVRS